MGRGGFTLIELLAVVVVIGLVAAAVGSTVAAGGVERRQRRAMEDVCALVGLVRAEAMRQSEDRRVGIGVEETGRLSLRDGARERTWDGTGLEIAGRGRTLAETVRERLVEVWVEFDGLGRTGARVIVLDGREAGGRLWVLRFDPVSGAVRVSASDQW